MVSSSTESPLSAILGLLAQPPRVSGLSFDTDYYAAKRSAASEAGAVRNLLPMTFDWKGDGPSERRVPLQLCEFLAYRTALAYEPGDRIEAFLKDCCSGTTAFQFFNSAHKDAPSYGVAADAQGYGFIFERKAFVIFRGTESGGNDWTINRLDALTSDLATNKDRRYTKLRDQLGPLMDKFGDPTPGRHVGFSIAWAALKDQVEDWLAKAFEDNAIDQIVYSGHSLGGAMAQIAAFDHARVADAIGKDRNLKIDHIAAVVTFGAPSVGSKKFAEEYRALLGTRTVLLESSGDLVPRIMERWYYRMLYPLRQRVKAGVQMHLNERDGYGKVATPWTFSSEPPLSRKDIDNALGALAAEAAKKMAATQQSAAAPKPKAASPEAPAKTDGGGQSTPSPSTSATTTTADGATTKATTSETSPSLGYWIVIGVFAIVVTGTVWYFVRRKLFSHDIEQRYALYLSTLSYQQLRAKHGGALNHANAELAEHLLMMRGDLTKSQSNAKQPGSVAKSVPFFASVQALPMIIDDSHMKDPLFADYLKQNSTFV